MISCSSPLANPQQYQNPIYPKPMPSQSSTRNSTKQEERSHDSALVHRCIQINAQMWTLPVHIRTSNEQLVKVIYIPLNVSRIIAHRRLAVIFICQKLNFTTAAQSSLKKANVPSTTTREMNFTSDNSHEIRQSINTGHQRRKRGEYLSRSPQ